MIFKPEHVEMIKNGTKTQTRRVWKKRRAKPGAIHQVKTKIYSKTYECKIKINAVSVERLGDITPQDAFKEGGYSINEYKKLWTHINGEWDPDLMVHVIDFELIAEED